MISPSEREDIISYAGEFDGIDMEGAGECLIGPIPCWRSGFHQMTPVGEDESWRIALVNNVLNMKRSCRA
jgi:hypothetical protein